MSARDADESRSEVDDDASGLATVASELDITTRDLVGDAALARGSVAMGCDGFWGVLTGLGCTCGKDLLRERVNESPAEGWSPVRERERLGGRESESERSMTSSFEEASPSCRAFALTAARSSSSDKREMTSGAADVAFWDYEFGSVSASLAQRVKIPG